MRLRVTGRAVVRCPNQHDFEVDMFDPEQMAIQRFVCELCGAKFSAEMPPVAVRPSVTAAAGLLQGSAGDSGEVRDGGH